MGSCGPALARFLMKAIYLAPRMHGDPPTLTHHGTTHAHPMGPNTHTRWAAPADAAMMMMTRGMMMMTRGRYKPKYANLGGQPAIDASILARNESLVYPIIGFKEVSEAAGGGR